MCVCWMAAGKTWSDAGLPVERGTPPKVKAEPDFGVKIPAQPQLMLDMEQARGLLHRQDASLVSIRSWPEFIGTTSGYSYIKPKGEIAGARWGHAGSDRRIWKIFITRMAPCAAPMILPLCGKRGISNQSSKFHSTAAPAGARPKPLCTHAPWVGRMFPCMTAAGTNGAAIQKIR
ncbi:putative thiosulfate sulfurtransferase [Escherichia coli]|nr:putative thiosulfate sulfurtransferase [Escherichia coli]